MSSVTPILMHQSATPPTRRFSSSVLVEFSRSYCMIAGLLWKYLTMIVRAIGAATFAP